MKHGSYFIVCFIMFSHTVIAVNFREQQYPSNFICRYLKILIFIIPTSACQESSTFGKVQVSIVLSLLAGCTRRNLYRLPFSDGKTLTLMLRENHKLTTFSHCRILLNSVHNHRNRPVSQPFSCSGRKTRVNKATVVCTYRTRQIRFPVPNHTHSYYTHETQVY